MEGILEEEDSVLSGHSEHKYSHIPKLQLLSGNESSSSCSEESKEPTYSEPCSPAILNENNEGYPELVKGINMASTMRKLKSRSTESSNKKRTPESNKGRDSSYNGSPEVGGFSPRERTHKTQRKTVYAGNLERISRGELQGDVYELVRTVLGKQKLWEQKKVKDEEILGLVIEEWGKTQEFYLHSQQSYEALVDELTETQTGLDQLQDSRTLMEREFEDFKYKITDEKISFDLRNKTTDSNIEEANRENTALLGGLEKTRECYMKKMQGAKEKEARFLMYVEDAKTHLIILRKERTRAEGKSIKNKETLTELDPLSLAQSQQKKRIQALGTLLLQVSQYTAKDPDIQLFNHLNSLYESLGKTIYEAREVYSVFKQQATADPKLILPYSRTSKPLINSHT